MENRVVVRFEIFELDEWRDDCTGGAGLIKKLREKIKEWLDDRKVKQVIRKLDRKG